MAADGARRPRVASTLNEINVVPLVDVMLVLLIIFMVTAPMMQRGLDVNLPQARRAQEINDQRLFVSVPLSYRKDPPSFDRRGEGLVRRPRGADPPGDEVAHGQAGLPAE